MPKIRAESLSQHHDLTWGALVGALEQLLAFKPYESITLAEIALAAGIARNTVYNYARDKPALLAAAAKETSEVLLSRVADLARGRGNAAGRLAAVNNAILRVFSSDARRLILMHSLFESVPTFVQAQASAPLTRMLDHVATIVAEGVDNGEFRRVDDPSLLIDLMAGVMLPAVKLVARNPGRVADVEAAVTDFMSGAIGLPPTGVMLTDTPKKRETF